MEEEQKQSFVNRCDGETRPPRRDAVSSRLFSVVLWSTLGVSVVLAGTFAILFSGLFKVKSLEVSGLRTVNSRVAISAFERSQLSAKFAALIGPDSYFFWKSGSLASPFPEFAPIIARAVTEKSLGSRSVLISVEERRPFGVWCPELSPCVAFDESGIAFAYVSTPTGSLIVRVDDDNERTIALGSSVFPSALMSETFVGAVSTVRSRGFPIIRVHIGSSELREWEIESVPFGMRFSFDAVPDGFGDVLRDLSLRSDLGKLTYLDFRVPGRVYYR